MITTLCALALSLQQQIAPPIGVQFMPFGEGKEEQLIESIREQIRIGVRAYVLSINWRDLDKSGTVSTKPIDDAVGLTKLLGADLIVSIKTIDTGQVQLPEDLEGKAFDDPAVMTRFAGFLSKIAPSFKGLAKYVSLGNEVDGYLLPHPDAIAPYMRMLAGGRGVLRALMPGVQLGVTTTFEGMRRNKQLVTDLHKEDDVVFMTYYPLTDQYKPRPLSEIGADFAAMAAFSSPRKFALAEVGMPASEELGSSEANQAEFVDRVFDQLGKHRGDYAFASFFAQHDFPTALVDVFQTYYGVSDPHFRAYLSTLGFRKQDGTPRLAWRALAKGFRTFYGQD